MSLYPPNIQSTSNAGFFIFRMNNYWTVRNDHRGVSSVIAVILMVAVVIIFSTTISVFVLGFTVDLNEPAPNVAETTGEFTTADGKAGDEQTVRITHIAGDSVDVEELEIIVRASGPTLDTEARLVDLPSDGYFSRSIDDSNIQGNEGLIDSGFEKARIVVVEDSNVWSAGKTIEFRVGVGEADFREPPKSYNPAADKLEVIIVHTPSNAILFDQTFTA